MALLVDKSAFLALALPIVEVEIPELGGSVRLRALTVGDREAVMRTLSAENLTGLSAMLKLQIEQLARAIVDADNKPFLTVADLGKMNPVVLDRLFDELNKLSAPVTAETVDAKKKR